MSSALTRLTIVAATAAAVLAVALAGHRSLTPAHATARPHRSSKAPTFATTLLTVPAANKAFGAAHDLRMPRGWHAEVWALVPDARFEQWTPGDSALLVSQPSNGTITELTPRAGHPGAVPTQRTLLSGLDDAQGMAFDRVGTRWYLYVAATDQIDRFTWVHGRASDEKVLVTGLGGQGDHDKKEVVIKDHDLYVDIGSDTNATPIGPSSAGTARIVEYTESGAFVRTMARGVRNGDGLSFAPDGTLWTAVNNRDQIAYPFHHAYGGDADAYGQVISAYVNNHPPDEVAKITPGRNLGWPYCNPDPDVHPGAQSTAFHYTNLPFDRDVQNNPTGEHLDCAKLAPLNVGLPAHSAPLGFHFLTQSTLSAYWRDGAVLAAHGSWDDTVPRAPAVLWLRWSARLQTLEPAITLIGGFQAADGDRWGRPVDVAAGQGGTLYVSDDQAGAIYRITP